MHRGPILAAAIVATIAFPALARAQAWLPERGEAAFAISYSDILNKKHYLPNGDEIDVGHTRTHSLTLAGLYAVTDRVTAIASIPYVQAEYHGDRPHPSEVDDGHSHSTFTDFRVELHVQALLEPLALAPYVAAIIPSHGYEVVGHAAPGRGLHEYWAGFYVGKSLERWLARTYVQARYNYAFVEKVADIGHDTSNIDLEIGYFFTPEWNVRAMGFWQKTHGGIDVPIPVSHPLFPYHDQLAASDYLNLGVGSSWVLTPRSTIDLLYLRAVHGRNGHKLDSGLTVGFSFTPSRR